MSSCPLVTTHRQRHDPAPRPSTVPDSSWRGPAGAGFDRSTKGECVCISAKWLPTTLHLLETILDIENVTCKVGEPGCLWVIHAVSFFSYSYLLVQHMRCSNHATAARYIVTREARAGEAKARHPRSRACGLGGCRFARVYQETRDKCPPHAPRAAHGHFTDVAQNVSQRASKSWKVNPLHKNLQTPKVFGQVKVNANGAGREFGNPSCGRALPNALVEPDGLLRPLLRTPIPRCSGPREPGVAAASTARRGRCERSRRALAPRPPRPPELRGACGRAACAPRQSARRRLPSVTAEPRVPPPNAQVSERAKACRARRTR